jgi:hypothetical protein
MKVVVGGLALVVVSLTIKVARELRFTDRGRL